MKYTITTLGCKVNTYESNVIRGLLDNHGYEYNEDDYDIAIINTCCVTNQAAAKSRKAIRQSRKQHPTCTIAVIGCYPQGFLEEVKRMEECDIVIGNKDKLDIVNILDEYFTKNEQFILVNPILKDYRYNHEIGKSFSTTRAFVKIQDGCQNFCSYCIIPYTRGPLTSKRHDAIVKEINSLVTQGYNEVVLSGINIGTYRDCDITFSGLIAIILKETTVKRLRISSIEVLSIDDDLIKQLSNPRLANHLHIPLQAGSHTTLKAMNRHYSPNEYRMVIDKIRQVKPNIAITTDMMVGFPGESNDDFSDSLAFAKEIGFAKIHVFPFSSRKDTKAANLVQIPSKEKEARAKILLSFSEQLQEKYINSFIGRELNVLVEERNGDLYKGHAENYLLIHINQEVAINEFVAVIVTEYTKNKIMGNVLINMKNSKCD